MARQSKSVFLSLDTLSFDEYIYLTGGGGFGGGPPGLTPYMWTLYFLADGSTLSVNAGATVSGAAKVMPTVGDREDLGSPSMHVGDSVRIGSDLGLFSTTLQAIPVDPSLQSILGPDLPGMFGAVAVVMMQNGYLTDDLARVGENALNSYVTQAIASLIASLGPNHTTITPGDISALTSGAGAAVKSAIENALSTWQEIEIFFEGTDSEIGDATWTFSQDDFPDASDTQDITKQVGATFNQWSIHGVLTVTNQCAADSTLFSLRKSGAFGAPKGEQQAEAALAAMRRFRDSGELRKVPTAGWWWDLACAHSAELAGLVHRDPAVRERVAGLLRGVTDVLSTPDKPIPEAFLRELASVLDSVRAGGSPALARKAERGLWAAHRLLGKSLHEAEAVLAAARRPGTKTPPVVTRKQPRG
jgi:hypothetical protein